MSEIVTAGPVVSLTVGAAEETKALLAKPENAGKMLRIFVEQSGCSGMQYGMVFDEKRDGDQVAEQHGVTALVDPFSAQYLRRTVWISATLWPAVVSKSPIPTQSRVAAVGNLSKLERTRSTRTSLSTPFRGMRDGFLPGEGDKRRVTRTTGGRSQ